MNGPRIGGIEPPEPTPPTPPPSAETSASIRAESPQEDRKTFRRASGLLLLVAGLAMVVASGAGIYAHLHVRVALLQTQLTQTRAAAQAALEEVGSLKIPKDLSTEVASLEVTANKLRAAEEALRRRFNDEMQKLPALETRLSEAQRALLAKQTEAEQELKAFQEKNEGRLTNIIAVLRNQDKVLRRLAEASAAPQNEE